MGGRVSLARKAAKPHSIRLKHAMTTSELDATAAVQPKDGLRQLTRPSAFESGRKLAGRFNTATASV